MTDKNDVKDTKQLGTAATTAGTTTAATTALNIIQRRGSLDQQGQQRVKDMLSRLKQGGHLPGSGLSQVITIDTTGSMGPYFTALRAGVDQVTSDIYSFAPGTRIAVVAYKDHNEGKYVTRPSGFFDKPADLKRFLDDPGIALGEGGGDAEALECALYDAWELLKGEESRTKVIVNIGDQPPHGVVDGFERCPLGRRYEDIAREVSQGGGRMYMVTCGTRQETVRVYDQMAQETNGARLDLANITDLNKQLTAIAGASTGKLRAVEDLLKARSGGQLAEGDRMLLEAVNPGYKPGQLEKK